MTKQTLDKEEIQSYLAAGAEWTDELERETDRGAAVLAMAFIDHLLDAALRKALVINDKSEKGKPFVHLGPKINWARALGIISAAVYEDLSQLNKIRNKFAHNLGQGLNFETPTIARICHKLRVTRAIPEVDTPRTQFIFTAVLVARYIYLRTDHLIRLEAPKGWRIAGTS